MESCPVSTNLYIEVTNIINWKLIMNYLCRCKIVNYFRKDSKHLNDSALTLLGIYLKQMKIHPHESPYHNIHTTYCIHNCS